MRAAQLDRKHRCPGCNGNSFIVEDNPLYGNGPEVAFVKCVNNNCGEIIGQLEPSSITTNLAQINEVMKQVAKALKTFNKAMSNQSSNVESNSDKPAVAAKSAVAASNPAPAQNDQNGIKPNASAEVKPEEDLASSDPEADQSLE